MKYPKENVLETMQNVGLGIISSLSGCPLGICGMECNSKSESRDIELVYQGKNPEGKHQEFTAEPWRMSLITGLKEEDIFALPRNITE